MSLLSDLVKTYDHVIGHEPYELERIAPIGHQYGSKKQVIDVAIDENGVFLDAFIDNKCSRKSLLAVTEESAARTSSAATMPHALNDSLMFMSSGHYLNKEGVNASYIAYMKQLGEWCSSEVSCPQIKAVYQYLLKHDLVDDLIEHGKLNNAKGEAEDPVKFMKHVVRWIVQTRNADVAETWVNEEVLRSWSLYYSALHESLSPCIIDGLDGEKADVAALHPKAISAYGNSKLISVAAKEDSTLHFKGERFNNQNQVLQIGYQNSQKAHNALSWLINTQSVAISKNSLPFGNSEDKPKYIVCWSPDLSPDEADNVWGEAFEILIKDIGADYKIYDEILKRGLYGLKGPKELKQSISILELDRSGDGRFSPVLYRSFTAIEFWEKVIAWFEQCQWHFWDRSQQRTVPRSPSIFDIAKSAYGIERINDNGNCYLDVNDSVFKDTVNTLLSIVWDGGIMPDSLIRKITIQASSPERFSGKEGSRWRNWNEILNTACAVIHYKHMKMGKGDCDLILDRTNHDRSYLFGRLLAVLDRIENTALYKKESSSSESRGHRDTNAMRLWSAYAAHPWTTFSNLRNCIQPYLSSLNVGSREFYQNEMQEILLKLDTSDRKINRQLEPEYLMGFYLERDALTGKKSHDDSDNNEESDEEV